MKRIELKYVVNEKYLLLDYLLKNVEGKSKNNIKSLLKNGNVSINGISSTKYNYELKKGDIVVIKLSQVENMSSKNNIDILYEDKYLIAVNKPNGLLTISTEKEKVKTLYHYVSSYVKKENKGNKIFIVHRLDRDTSGIVLFAKNEEVKKELQYNWNEVVKIRKYIAIVNGITDEKGRIESYINENDEHYSYSTNSKDGKLAITEYKRIKSNRKYSLIEINIFTGRKNQIRVHMKDINHPIVGDIKYGMGDNLIKRFALHFKELKFVHPVTKKEIDINSEIPSIFNKIFIV